MPNLPKAPGEDLPDMGAEVAGGSAEEVLVVRDDAADAVREALEVSDAQAAAFAATELYCEGVTGLRDQMQGASPEYLQVNAGVLFEVTSGLTPLARTILSGAFREHPDLLPVEHLEAAKGRVRALSEEERRLRILEARMLVHDANNVMSVIMGALELLEIGRNVPDQVARIRRASQKLQGLITPHEGKTLKDVFALLEPGASLQVGIPFEVVGDLELQPTLSAPRLARVLYNLMTNAASAKAQKVTLYVQKNDGKMVLTVKDDGPGFGGVEPIKTREEADKTGHGNALQIALQFCELSGGSLTHGDLDQAGAEWVIELPLKN